MKKGFTFIILTLQLINSVFMFQIKHKGYWIWDGALNSDYVIYKRNDISFDSWFKNRCGKDGENWNKCKLPDNFEAIKKDGSQRYTFNAIKQAEGFPYYYTVFDKTHNKYPQGSNIYPPLVTNLIFLTLEDHIDKYKECMKNFETEDAPQCNSDYMIDPVDTFQKHYTVDYMPRQDKSNKKTSQTKASSTSKTQTKNPTQTNSKPSQSTYQEPEVPNDSSTDNSDSAQANLPEDQGPNVDNNETFTDVEFFNEETPLSEKYTISYNVNHDVDNPDLNNDAYCVDYENFIKDSLSPCIANDNFNCGEIIHLACTDSTIDAVVVGTSIKIHNSITILDDLITDTCTLIDQTIETSKGGHRMSFGLYNYL